MRPTVLILTALLAVACSSGESDTPAPSSAPATSAAVVTAGKCSDVAKSGAAVTDALIDQGCLDDNGTKRLGTVQQCKSGRRLWEMGDLVGLSGGEMVPSDLQMEGRRADQVLGAICRTQ